MHKNSSTTHELATNLHSVRRDISTACSASGRDAADVTLIAVSKGHDFQKIHELYRAGQRHFGESYAQEFALKYKQAQALHLDIVWHFIGGIQSNKLKLIKDANVIHSIGSLRHATLLSEIVSKDVKIFVQINLAQNPSQQGVSESDAKALIMAIKALPKLKLCGLMTIAPIDENDAAVWFSRMAQLKKDIIAQGVLDEVALSMGMSDDFIDAIHHGANFVRVGTKIFGPRQ